jgi:outer membrane protein TolC
MLPPELNLADILLSVHNHFPLLYAVEQERLIAFGQRQSAAGGFDTNLRGRGFTQGGSFANSRYDFLAEQPTTLHGLSFYTGYRFGWGDFPVYYGDRKTADGGEFRSGFQLPFLRDGPIDRRRVALRQARIAMDLADPTVRRARIDYFRNASRAYWSWCAAGEQLTIAEELLRIANERQQGLEEQFRRGQIPEFAVIDNRRLIVEREGNQIAATRRLQQTAFDLSLFLRDESGNPMVPDPKRLPTGLLKRRIAPPTPERLPADIQIAQSLRPEIQRFALLKERSGVDLRYAENQRLPTLTAGLAGVQDVGASKKGTGIFAPDNSVIEGSILFEMPFQRRDAAGRISVARGQLAQLMAQERFARDQITAEVQDTTSNLDQTFQRIQRAREEQEIAARVAQLELERFRKGQGTLLEVNLRELAAAGAKSKVIDAIAEFYRAYADYRAAMGLDFDPGEIKSPPPGS